MPFFIFIESSCPMLQLHLCSYFSHVRPGENTAKGFNAHHVLTHLSQKGHASHTTPLLVTTFGRPAFHSLIILQLLLETLRAHFQSNSALFQIVSCTGSRQVHCCRTSTNIKSMQQMTASPWKKDRRPWHLWGCSAWLLRHLWCLASPL